MRGVGAVTNVLSAQRLTCEVEVGRRGEWGSRSALLVSQVMRQKSSLGCALLAQGSPRLLGRAPYLRWEVMPLVVRNPLSARFVRPRSPTFVVCAVRNGKIHSVSIHEDVLVEVRELCEDSVLEIVAVRVEVMRSQTTNLVNERAEPLHTQL